MITDLARTHISYQYSRLSKIGALSHAHMKFVHTTGPITFAERN
ncbi:hypothetical protein V6Z11_1Z036500 [Gossypium hirsutum]